MEFKTHKILAALRKLRDEGYTGKVNPALIRELTGIERTGSALCDMRKAGYLINAGFIHLPAHRGLTRANEYRINPKSDLIPRQKYNIGKHQEMVRNRESMRVKPCQAFNAFLYGGLA